MQPRPAPLRSRAALRPPARRPQITRNIALGGEAFYYSVQRVSGYSLGGRATWGPHTIVGQWLPGNGSINVSWLRKYSDKVRGTPWLLCGWHLRLAGVQGWREGYPAPSPGHAGLDWNDGHV